MAASATPSSPTRLERALAAGRTPACHDSGGAGGYRHPDRPRPAEPDAQRRRRCLRRGARPGDRNQQPAPAADESPVDHLRCTREHRLGKLLRPRCQSQNRRAAHRRREQSRRHRRDRARARQRFGLPPARRSILAQRRGGLLQQPDEGERHIDPIPPAERSSPPSRQPYGAGPSSRTSLPLPPATSSTSRAALLHASRRARSKAARPSRPTSRSLRFSRSAPQFGPVGRTDRTENQQRFGGPLPCGISPGCRTALTRCNARNGAESWSQWSHS